MTYTIYDYIDAGGVNPIREWAASLQKKELAKLNQKIDMLRLNGTSLLPETLAGTDVPGILKLRVRGNVQLRPLLCDGPEAVGMEFTFLAGAKEVQSRLVPNGVLNTALTRKHEVIAEPINRRRPHERVG